MESQSVRRRLVRLDEVTFSYKQKDNERRVPPLRTKDKKEKNTHTDTHTRKNERKERERGETCVVIVLN